MSSVTPGDPDGTITFTAGTQTLAAGSTLTIAANGDYTFTPGAALENATAPVTETFSYTVTDNHGLSAASTLAVTVTVDGSGPVAAAAAAQSGDHQPGSGNLPSSGPLRAPDGTIPFMAG